MNHDLLRRLMTSVPLFHEFTEDELGKFLGLCKQQQLPKHQEVVEQDKVGSELYAVMSGSLLVQRCATTPKEKPVELARLKPGDVFGELSLVDSGPRSASVITLENSRLIYFDRSQIPDLPVSLQAKLYRNVATLLAKRLRTNNDMLSLLFTREKEALEKAKPAAQPAESQSAGFIPPKQRSVRRGV